MIDRLAEAQNELDMVMKMLKEKQDQLAEVEAKIAELQATYDNSVREKQKLERNIATTAARLKRAAKLTTALGDEQVRWAETVKVCTCDKFIFKKSIRVFLYRISILQAKLTAVVIMLKFYLAHMMRRL